MARQVSFSIDQGTTYTQNFLLYDNTGTTLILTGYTVTGHLSTSYYSYQNAYADDASPIIPFTTAIIDPINGIIQLSLTSAQTTALDSSLNYVYTVSLVDSGGNITRVMYGVITINPDIILIPVPPPLDVTWQHMWGQSMIVV